MNPNGSPADALDPYAEFEREVIPVKEPSPLTTAPPLGVMPDFSSIVDIDTARETITFWARGYAGRKVKLTWQQVKVFDLPPTMRGFIDSEIALARKKSASAPLPFPELEGILVGGEHDTFGTLIAVNARGGEAKFEKDGNRVIVSAAMMIEVADALERAGILSPNTTAAVARIVDPRRDSKLPSVPPPPTSADGMDLILKEVREASDPLVAAGEWLMKLTNAITAIAREGDDA